MPIRKPSVAGSFYPADASQIRRFCEPLLRPSGPLVSARALILPHAGYIYSGETACRVLARVKVPDTVFLMGPDHHGAGADFSLFPEGEWETPLGRTPIAENLTRALARGSRQLTADPLAHAAEHSLEVLLPLLQMKNPGLRIAPVLVGALAVDQAMAVAAELGSVLSEGTSETLVVISNDMSHYESDRATREKDRYALEAVEHLDAEALVKAVRDHRITMCGFLPVLMLLVMAKRLGIRRATLVDYRTSADATGDYDRVVGYAGFIFE